jgi:hypothetical protein
MSKSKNRDFCEIVKGERFELTGEDSVSVTLVKSRAMVTATPAWTKGHSTTKRLDKNHTINKKTGGSRKSNAVHLSRSSRAVRERVMASSCSLFLRPLPAVYRPRNRRENVEGRGLSC